MPRGFDDPLTQKLQWCTRGANCPICNALRGRIYTYDFWMSAGVWPGFHYHCNCYLKKAPDDAIISDLDFFGTKIDLQLDSKYAKWPAIAQFDPNWEPFTWYTIKEIEAAHIKYGSDTPIGEVLDRMDNDFEGFFKRSPIADQWFAWRVLRTIKHYQSIDGTYSGDRAVSPWADLKWFLFGSSPYSKNALFNRWNVPFLLHGQFGPNELIPWTPDQSYNAEGH